MIRIPLLAGTLLAATVSSAAADVSYADKPTPGKARIDLRVRKPSHFLGENVLVDFCVVNVDTTPIAIDVGGDYRGSSRALRFKVEVRDAHGKLLADPDPNPYNLGGISYTPKIAPGKKWCHSLPIWRYARFDTAGTYTIKATHDLGWPEGRAPSATTSIAFAMPTPAQAAEVLAKMQALPTDPSTSAGDVAIDYQDFQAIRYDVYVQPLVEHITHGHPAAFDALAQIPTKVATRALIDFLATSDPQLLRAAAQALSLRLPDPALTGGLGSRNPFENTMSDQRRYLSQQAWDPAFADPVREAGRRMLLAGNVVDEIDGAFMLEALGMPADGAELTKALDRAIDRTTREPVEEFAYPPPHGACMELMRAAKILIARGMKPAAVPSTPGQIAVWLEAVKAGARPTGWEAQLARAVEHPIAYVRDLALDHAPSPLPAQVERLIKTRLADANVDVVVAAARVAERDKLQVLRPDVLAALTKPAVAGLRLDIVYTAAYALGARLDGALALVTIMETDPKRFGDAFGELLQLLDAFGSSRSGEAVPAVQKTVSAAWRTLVMAKRGDIAASTKIALTDPAVTPALFPPGWTVGRLSGTQYPPQTP